MSDKEQTSFETTFVFSRPFSFTQSSVLYPWDKHYGTDNESFLFWSEFKTEHTIHMLADDLESAKGLFTRLAERLKTINHLEIEVKDVTPFVYPEDGGSIS